MSSLQTSLDFQAWHPKHSAGDGYQRGLLQTAEMQWLEVQEQAQGMEPYGHPPQGKKRESHTAGGQGQPERHERSQGHQPPRDRLVKATSVGSGTSLKSWPCHPTN